MKQYPLEVDELRDADNNELIGWYTKGHHDIGEFYHAVVSRHLSSGARLPIHVGTARHEWSRTVYDVNANNGTVNLTEAVPGSRGAFPVTIAEAVSPRTPQMASMVVDPHATKDSSTERSRVLARIWNRVVSAFR